MSYLEECTELSRTWITPFERGYSKSSGSHGWQTGKMLIELEEVLQELKSDLVLVLWENIYDALLIGMTRIKSSDTLQNRGWRKMAIPQRHNVHMHAVCCMIYDLLMTDGEKKARTTLVLDESVVEKLRRASPNNISSLANRILREALFKKGESLFGELRGLVSTEDIVEEEAHEELYC